MPTVDGHVVQRAALRLAQLADAPAEAEASSDVVVRLALLATWPHVPS